MGAETYPAVNMSAPWYGGQEDIFVTNTSHKALFYNMLLTLGQTQFWPSFGPSLGIDEPQTLHLLDESVSEIPATISRSFCACRQLSLGEMMQQIPVRLPSWLQHAIGTLGPFGLFLVSFLDSSILSFPVITDLLVIEMTVRKPLGMLYYAGLATAGSLAGCIWLYLLAKKGGEAYFHRHAGARAAHIRRWVDDHGFMSVFIPSLFPPPMPFKVFVIAEGVFQVPLRTFVLALIAGRGLRYFGEGILAIYYGAAVTDILVDHKLAVLIGLLALGAVILIAGKIASRVSPHRPQS